MSLLSRLFSFFMSKRQRAQQSLSPSSGGYYRRGRPVVDDRTVVRVKA